MTEAADGRARASLQDELRLCVGLLTRLPVSAPGAPAAGWLRQACRWFPLVGALVGGVGAAVLSLGSLIGLPAEASALAAVAAIALLTGALHEDGFADVADGFGAGRTREDRLRIMRDSRIGTYGTLALIIGVGLRWAALTALLRDGTGMAAVALIVAAAVSRLIPVLLMRFLPAARSDGLGATAGRPSVASVRVATALALMALLLLSGLAAMLAVIAAAALACASVELLARRCIGGHTGDVLGAGQQVAEILLLLALAAVAP